VATGRRSEGMLQVYKKTARRGAHRPDRDGGGESGTGKGELGPAHPRKQTPAAEGNVNRCVDCGAIARGRVGGASASDHARRQLTGANRTRRGPLRGSERWPFPHEIGDIGRATPGRQLLTVLQASYPASCHWVGRLAKLPDKCQGDRARGPAATNSYWPLLAHGERPHLSWLPTW